MIDFHTIEPAAAMLVIFPLPCFAFIIVADISVFHAAAADDYFRRLRCCRFDFMPLLMPPPLFFMRFTLPLPLSPRLL